MRVLKLHGDKSYHPYLANDKCHNKKFVNVVLKEIIECVSTIPHLSIIESDNCSAQYKSTEHFYNIQSLAGHFNIPIIQVFVGHKKGGVDHVGSLAKCGIR